VIISIDINETKLATYTDEFLAVAWHVAQANPAPNGDRLAGDLAEQIGREIITRWLRAVCPELWAHQGRSYFHNELCKLAKYEPGEGDTGSPGWYSGHWVPRGDEASAGAR
jgi:hypothetical protein